MTTKMLTANDIINKGRYAKTAEYTLDEHLELIQRMKDSGDFSVPMTTMQLWNVQQYFLSLPNVPAMKLLQAIALGYTGTPGVSENIIVFYSLPDNREKLIKVVTDPEVLALASQYPEK